jgi:hypothetical protein
VVGKEQTAHDDIRLGGYNRGDHHQLFMAHKVLFTIYGFEYLPRVNPDNPDNCLFSIGFAGSRGRATRPEPGFLPRVRLIAARNKVLSGLRKEEFLVKNMVIQSVKKVKYEKIAR